MRVRFTLSFLLLTAAVWAQIDTRIYSTPPASTAQAAESPPAKQSDPQWNGTRLIGFLDESLGSSLKEGLETTLAVSEAVGRPYTGANDSPNAVDEWSLVTGTASFHHEWSHSSMIFQYAGGTSMYVKNSELDNQFHQLAGKEAFKVSRWNFSFGEHYTYVPESSYGFNPAHDLGNGLTDGSGPPGPNVFLPQNIIERSVSTDAAAAYTLSHRSQISFNGGFTDLHFSGTAPGLLLADSQLTSAGAQDTYSLSSRNSMGVEYGFVQVRALGFDSLIQTHSVLGTYELKLGRRVRLQVAAGPEFTTSNQFGSEINSGTSLSVDARAEYHLARTDVGISYFRGTNAGSGLFLGSNSDDVRGFVGRKLSRSLHASVAAGYSRNSSLGLPAIIAAQRIAAIYFTGSLDRNFGPIVSAFTSYTLQDQDSNSALCNAAGCSVFPLFQSGMIGIRFHIHPLATRR
jgi:hypothetical protein